MRQAIEVANHNGTVFARIHGLGSFSNAGPFREYVDAMVQHGTRQIVIDLEDCVGLDSTFLGVIMGFLSCPIEETDDQTIADYVTVTIVNSTAEAQRALESVGLCTLLDVREGHVEIPRLKLQLLKNDWLDERRRVLLIRHAHENLVRLDKRNEEKFGPFIRALMADIESRNSRDKAQ